MPRTYESACEVLFYLGEPGEAQSHLLKGLLNGLFGLVSMTGRSLDAQSIDWDNLTQHGLPEAGNNGAIPEAPLVFAN